LWAIIVIVTAALAFGGLSGVLVRPVAACDDYYVIWGPIPVHTEVTYGVVTSSFDGKAETDRILFGIPCTEYRQFNVNPATFVAKNTDYNWNVFWLFWLPSGFPIGSVHLDSDEWIAQGGAGSNYVYIGQYPGTPCPPVCTFTRHPSLNAQVPRSLWGVQFQISMRMAYNTWDCSSPFAMCSGTTTYIMYG
jgi:hypothetical protein